MFRGWVHKILKEKLGEYLYGFKEDQLEIGLFNGRVKLDNVTFKPDKINEHPLLERFPLVLKAGIIGRMQIDIKYTDLGSVDVLIEDLFVVVGPNFSHLKKRTDYQANEEKFFELSKKLQGAGDRFEVAKPLETFKTAHEEQNIKHILDPKYELDQIYKKKLRGDQEDEESSPNNQKRSNESKTKTPKTNEDNPLIKALLNSEFLKNQRVTINRIHIRYEDDQLTYKEPLALGFMISSIKITPNQEVEIGIPVNPENSHFGYYQTEKKHIDSLVTEILEHPNGRGLSYQVAINNIECYITPKSEMYIPYSLYESTMYSPHGIFEAMPPLELKTLMMSYFQNIKHHKHPLLHIAEIKSQALVAIRQDVSRNYRQYVLLKTEINNLTIELKPDILQDAIDMATYYKHDKNRQILDRFRPEIRPILSQKIYNMSAFTKKLRREIIREWWRLVLWFNRIKRSEGRLDLVEKLHTELQNSSLLKRLQNKAKHFDNQKLLSQDEKQSNFKNLVSHTIIRNVESDSTREIFPHQYDTALDNVQEPDENYERFKRPFIYAFLELKSLNVNFRKPNMKTFLHMRIEYIHLNALGNIDFEAVHSTTFHMSSFRIFYFYNDNPKQIFAGNPKQSHNHSHSQSHNQSYQKPSHNYSQMLFAPESNVQTPRRMENGIGFKEKLPNQSMLNYTEYTPGENLHQHDTRRTHSQQPRNKAAENLNTDVVIMELKSDFIIKFNLKKISPSARSVQIRTEIGEFEFKLENVIFKDIFDYFHDLRQNYSIRHMPLNFNIKNLRYRVEKQVITFESPEKKRVGRMPDSPAKSFAQHNAHSHINHHNASQMHHNMSQLDQSVLTQRQSPERSRMLGSHLGSHMGSHMMGSHSNLNMSKGESSYMDIFKNQYQNYLNNTILKTPETLMADLISPDPMNIFTRKLTHFFQANEVMLSMNIGGFTFTLTETAPQSVEKTDLLSMQIPRGKVFVSLNYNKKNVNVVDVYGFKLETSSKFQAIYSFIKKIKNIIKMGIEFNRDPNSKFYELMSKATLTMDEQEFRRLYAGNSVNNQ